MSGPFLQVSPSRALLGEGLLVCRVPFKGLFFFLCSFPQKI